MDDKTSDGGGDDEGWMIIKTNGGGGDDEGWMIKLAWMVMTITGG